MQILVPALVALSVALLTHFFSSTRDRNNKRREQRISYLVNAFRTLAKASNHPRLHEVAPEIEQAMADIQLLGSKEQIGLAHKFVKELSNGGEATLDPLLQSLRDSLRLELGATPIAGGMFWLKIEPGRQGGRHVS